MHTMITLLATLLLQPSPHLDMARSPVVHQITLRNHDVATLYADGVETLTDANGKVLRRRLAAGATDTNASSAASVSPVELLKPMLLQPRPVRPYVPNELLVVFGDGYAPAYDTFTVKRDELVKRHQVPRYGPSDAVNRAFAAIGVTVMERIARHIDRGRLAAFHGSLRIVNTYTLHVANSSVESAVLRLRAIPGIAYVSPDYYVMPMHTQPLVISPQAIMAARKRATQHTPLISLNASQQGFEPHAIPSNYAVSASAQSLLNAPGVDAVKTYDEVEEIFNQLPGQGETVANVSIGDVDDDVNTSDPCYQYGESFGPTVHLIGGQHYIDWPSMPLIPAYVVDSNGNASGSASACGGDPSLGEIGLDFSMMAPLPHQLQRGGETGEGYSDLLGIAPGAKYELFVPQNDGTASTSDILETFVSAALSSPRPDVITASIGFAEDAYGFPGRFLEDDALVEQTIHGIVDSGIVVCISANDGIRTYTPSAIGPSGGSAPTELAATSESVTNVDDLFFTTLASADLDSGSIDVGGTTLDDIFAAPMDNPANAGSVDQLTWPETRWTGFANFSSGFGTRVNIAAPADNVLAMSHNYDGAQFYDYDDVQVSLNGGTSAAAPEVAAAAAVVLQVARLTGHPFVTPQALRQFLISTAAPVPNVPQADQPVNVGPQLDLGRAVDTLLRKAGKQIPLAVPRVAIAQRRDAGDYDGAFLSDTLPWDVDLQGPIQGAGISTDENEYASITIAPDWEGVTGATKFRLTVVGKPHAILATTRWTRLLPEQILQAAGLPLVSASSRTVQLEYSASIGARVKSSIFSLTFSPADSTHYGGPAVEVAPVTTGSTIDVSYDLSAVREEGNPELVVSEPGRMIPTFDATGGQFHPSYTVALTKKKGTVHVPVSMLQGAGVYGIAIGGGAFTDFAFTRVVQGSSYRANPVTLSSGGLHDVHTLYMNYAQPYRVRWDVSNIPSADSALIEISAAAPSVWNSYNLFNNPNGSMRDHNGVDSPSIYTLRVSGVSGSITLDSFGTLTPALSNQIRVIPMRGSIAAGEASDPSFLGMNGIAPADGLPLQSVTTGDGELGELTTNDNVGDADAYALSEFNPYALTLQSSFALNAGLPGYFNPAGTVFPGDQQVMEEVFPNQRSGNYGSFSIYFYLWPLNQLTEGDIQAGTLPQITTPSGQQIVDLAYNRRTSLAAFVLGTSTATSEALHVYLSSLLLPNTTIGKEYDVTPAYYPPSITKSYTPVSGSLEVDPGLHTAIIEVGANPSGAVCKIQQHIVSTMSLSTGAITSFSTGGYDAPTQSTYDPGTHILASPDSCGDLVLTNVVSKTNQVIALPSYEVPFYDVADTRHHVLLIGFPVDPAYVTNNDAASVIDEYDENGNLLKTFNAFEFDNPALPTYLQIDEKTREMYVPEFSDSQIEPYHY